MVSTNDVVIALVLFSVVHGSRILFLSPLTAPSHSNFFKPVVKALADRGHSITYWNGLASPEQQNISNRSDKSANLRLLYSPEMERFNADYGIGFQDRDSPFRLFFDIPARMAKYCAAVYQDPIFHGLFHSNELYDLLVVEGMFNDCVLPLVRVFDVPFVYMNGIAPTPWLLDAVGSPLALDHFPNPGFSFPDEMSLWQRTFNALTGLMSVYFRRWFVVPVVDRMASKVLGDNLTSIEEIERRYLSLLITNTHLSINYQLPTSPAVIQTGGLHCVSAKPLTGDLASFVDGSGDAGFVVVSFGSILRGADMPTDVRRIFLKTFSRLPQRIVWKWEDESKLKAAGEDIPANVRLTSWMPQQDLLGHPKARLFITHCGLFSKQEAVYHGVPFIALPVFADQPINAKKAEADGYAIRLDWDELNEEILYDAIQLVMSDPRYRERMDQVSSLTRDQMERPLDRAVYWIEYVIRHQGAPHLRTASRKLSLYQRGLLDVTFVVFVSLLLMIYAFSRLVTLTSRMFSCRQLNNAKNSAKTVMRSLPKKPKAKLR